MYWDIFCKVVDNYGDVGFCWRLARQLKGEYKIPIRLWITHLPSLQHLWPSVQCSAAVQKIEGIDIHYWNNSQDFSRISPPEVVLETFGCGLPTTYLKKIQKQKTIWINIEHLSAEDWTAEYHCLPSPHPIFSLNSYFFYPGFNKKTGGLLRESSLLEKRLQFQQSHNHQEEAFWDSLAIKIKPHTFKVSLFHYINPALKDLLKTWAQGLSPILCIVPDVPKMSHLIPIEDIYKLPNQIREGQLQIIKIPFLSQSDYDRLLWACDLNFVRGEDSFIRAQWAGQPFVWHIYPQSENIHLKKLNAFLKLYLSDLEEEAPPAARYLEEFWNAWNNPDETINIYETWVALYSYWEDIKKHSHKWTNTLISQEDLVSQLVTYVNLKRI